MPPLPLVCEPCAEAGMMALADDSYQYEETSLIGRRLLCREQDADLPVDSQMERTA